MTEAVTFLNGHPALGWLAIAAILLAIEVATGTGWILWAAGSAGVVCLVAIATPIGLPWELALFALLAIGSSLLGRRLLPRAMEGAEGDINDNVARLIGRQARVVADFTGGRGRVSIDGKEWAAVLAAGEAPASGGAVEVVSANGAELSVRGA